APALGKKRAWGPHGHRIPRFFEEALVERRVAQGAGGRAVIQQQDLRADRPVEAGDDCRPSALRVVSAYALEQIGRQRLDEHLDRAAPRGPRLPPPPPAPGHLQQAPPGWVQHLLRLLRPLGVRPTAAW